MSELKQTSDATAVVATPIAPVAASVEIVPDRVPVAVLPLETRLRQVRRRRALLDLREWAAVVAVFSLALALTVIAVLSLVAH